MKVLCTAFKCLQFGFVVFWQKDFGAKAAHEMLAEIGIRFILLIKHSLFWLTF
jgi:hypothetical protein